MPTSSSPTPSISGHQDGLAWINRDLIEKAEVIDARQRVVVDQSGQSLAAAGAAKRIENWSLTSPQHRLVKTGGRLVKRAWYYWLLLAEGHLTRQRFRAMLGRIALLPMPTVINLPVFEAKRKSR